MKTYFIDGNNFLGELGQDRSPQYIRALINRLDNAPIKGKFIVVFDGQTPFGKDSIDTSRVSIHWQEWNMDTDGDDTMVRIGQKISDKNEVFCVTKDKLLKSRLRDAGFKQIISPYEMDRILNRRYAAPQPEDDKDKAWSEIDHDSLNQELLEAFSKPGSV